MRFTIFCYFLMSPSVIFQGGTSPCGTSGDFELFCVRPQLIRSSPALQQLKCQFRHASEQVSPTKSTNIRRQQRACHLPSEQGAPLTVAVCLSGHIRTFTHQLAYQSVKEHLLDVLSTSSSVSVFLHLKLNDSTGRTVGMSNRSLMRDPTLAELHTVVQYLKPACIEFGSEVPLNTSDRGGSRTEFEIPERMMDMGVYLALVSFSSRRGRERRPTPRAATHPRSITDQ